MDKTRRAAWLLVVAAALGMSWWSLYYVATHLGAPQPAAALVSVMFDGAALICADLALRSARLGDSTFGPSAGLLIAAGLSAWFNSLHASVANLPFWAGILFAAAPVIAVTVTELQLRHDRRAALRDKGRLAEPLPAFGGATWFHHPWGAWAAQRTITAHRLKNKREDATRDVPRESVTSSRPAGGRTEPGPERPAASGAPRTKLAPERRAEVLRLMRSDLAAGVELSKSIAQQRYDLSAYHAETLLAEARQVPNGQLASVR